MVGYGELRPKLSKGRQQNVISSSMGSGAGTALGLVRHKGTWKPSPLTHVEPSIRALLEAPLLLLAEAQVCLYVQARMNAALFWRLAQVLAPLSSRAMQPPEQAPYGRALGISPATRKREILRFVQRY